MVEPENGNGSLDHPCKKSQNLAVLDYLCDIISELKALSDRSGQRTLSAILAAALVEARLQKDESTHI